MPELSHAAAGCEVGAVGFFTSLLRGVCIYTNIQADGAYNPYTKVGDALLKGPRDAQGFVVGKQDGAGARFTSAGMQLCASNVYVGSDLSCDLSDLRANSLTTIGYRKLPGGDIEQWGRINIGSVSGSAYAVGSPKNIDITFPIAFPNECFNMQVTAHPSDDGATTNSGRGSGTLRAISKTGATIGVEPHMDGYAANFYLHWRAKGK